MKRLPSRLKNLPTWTNNLPLSKQVAFDYLAEFHLLRAIPAEAAEFVISVTKCGGGVTDNFRGKRVGDAYGLCGSRGSSVDTLLIDDTAEKALHAFRESIV